jgi:hypothetical protein
MCQICETTQLCQRLARHIKNIDDGGPISPAAVREVMSAALADLTRYQLVATISLQIMRGNAIVEVVDLSEEPASTACGAVH